MNSNSETGIPTPQPQRAPAAQPVAPAAPTRHVGSLTAGVSFILAGALLFASLFYPHFNYALVLRFAPLLLVLLGVEVLWSSIHAGSARIKYDVGGLVLCALVICAALCATVVCAVCLYGQGAF